MEIAIRTQDLRKSFDARVAVDDLSFEVHAGETFGLLGPNGAGKSTTIRMLVGAMPPDSGAIEIAGQSDPARTEVKRSLGYVPQEIALYDELSARENLEFFGRLQGLGGRKLRDRVGFALDFAGLESRAKDLVGTFSGGMKRRLNLACALLHEPRVLFLDEPTVGVDPQSRAHIFANIESLAANGTTMLYTTHAMDAAERLCDRIAIVDHGKILSCGRVDELLEQHGTQSEVRVELASELSGAEALRDLQAEIDGRTLTVRTRDPMAFLAKLAARKLEVTKLELRRSNLEDVFLALTGRSLRDT